MNKPKWLSLTLHILRKAFFAVAALIVVLFALAVTVFYFFPPKPTGCDPLALIPGGQNDETLIIVPRPPDIALNRSEE